MSTKKVEIIGGTYAIGERAVLARITPSKRRFSLITALGLHGKVKKPKQILVPTFRIVGDDKESIKLELNRLVDELFEQQEEQEKQ